MTSASMRIPQPDLEESTARKLDAAAKAYLDKHLAGQHEAARAVIDKARRRYGREAALYRIFYTLAEDITTTCPEDLRTTDGTPRITKILPPPARKTLRESLAYTETRPNISSAAIVGVPTQEPPVPKGLDVVNGVLDVQARTSAWVQRMVEAVNNYQDDDFSRVLGEIVYHPGSEGPEQRIQAVLAVLAIVCAVTNGRLRINP